MLRLGIHAENYTKKSLDVSSSDASPVAPKALELGGMHDGIASGTSVPAQKCTLYAASAEDVLASRQQ